MNDIEKTDNNVLAVGGVESLASFYVPGEIDRAYQESGWDVREMIETLLSIVRSEETTSNTKRDGTIITESVVTPKERMAAIKMLQDLNKESMVLNGLIQNQRLHMEKVLEDGTKVEYDTETMSVIKDGSSRLMDTMSLLDHGAKSNEIIDVDYKVKKEKEENDEHTRRRNGSPDEQSSGSTRRSGPSGARDSDGRRDGSGGDEQNGAVFLPTERSGGSDSPIKQRQPGNNNQSTKPNAKQREEGSGDDSGEQPIRHNGSQHEPDDGHDGANVRKYPTIPGGSYLQSTGPLPPGSDPSRPGIPIRLEGTEPDPTVRTAESIASRLARIEEAREAKCNNTAGRTQNSEPTKE